MEHDEKAGHCARCGSDVEDMTLLCPAAVDYAGPHLPAASADEVVRSIAEFGPSFGVDA